MTVIAWDGNSLAADKLSTDGTARSTTTKIQRTPDGELIGACGAAAACREIVAWYLDGAKPETFPPTQRVESTAAWLLIIASDRGVHYVQTSPHPMRYEDERFAIGSGRDFAIAAMFLGKNAREAVEVACALTTCCGQGIDTLTLE